MEARQTGCGHSMSHFLDIVPLGGWGPAHVSLAYAALGDGRVWLANLDWQDDDEVITDASRALTRRPR